MDILSQGIAGAVAAQGVSRKSHWRTATVIGLLAGLLPDVDILINSAEDPLLRLEYHRQFSHAVVFIPAGALLMTLVTWPIVRRRLDFQHIYIYSLLGISMGGLLDACTSFGTHLLWPFSDARTAWNLIAVVDPLFTLFLIVPLVLGWRSRKRRYPLLAIALASTYLLFGYSQNQTVGRVQQVLAKGRGHQATMAVVKPTIGNTLLWRSIYRHDDQYFVDAIHANPFGDIRIYPGQSIAAFPSTNADALPEAYASYREDISRFSRLSSGYLVLHPKDSNVIGDIRYAMLPTSIEPLWGIRLDLESPGTGIEEATFRQLNHNDRQQFMEMLFGR